MTRFALLALRAYGQIRDTPLSARVDEIIDTMLMRDA